ncbi:MAG: E3 binding domain-containing protein, partial [Candidatus Eremiobacteraeota bacterium]|nr:E3 binding domain-containing protein [Candidatus Eremiobacteraeota bacterium]
MVIDVRVPDIGDFKDVPVIEVLVKAGDRVAKETPLVVLESEKASMEVPSSAAGTVSDVKVKAGDKVSEGSVIVTVEDGAAAQTSVAPARVTPSEIVVETKPPVAERPEPDAGRDVVRTDGEFVHAGPAIRRFARELGVDLHAVEGSGPHGRVTREDVQNFVKSALA